MMASDRTSVPSTSTCTRCPGRRSSSSEPSRAAAPKDRRTPSSSSTSPDEDSAEYTETVACTASARLPAPDQLCPGCDVGAAPPLPVEVAASAEGAPVSADAGLSCFAGSVCLLAPGVEAGDFLADDFLPGAGVFLAGAGVVLAAAFLDGAFFAAGAFSAGAVSTDEAAANVCTDEFSAEEPSTGELSTGELSAGVSVE